MAAGLDSLGAVELRNTLESAVNISLPPTLVFELPTAAAIAKLRLQPISYETAAEVPGGEQEVVAYYVARPSNCWLSSWAAIWKHRSNSGSHSTDTQVRSSVASTL